MVQFGITGLELKVIIFEVDSIIIWIILLLVLPCWSLLEKLLYERIFHCSFESLDSFASLMLIEFFNRAESLLYKLLEVVASWPSLLHVLYYTWYVYWVIQGFQSSLHLRWVNLSKQSRMQSLGEWVFLFENLLGLYIGIRVKRRTFIKSVLNGFRVEVYLWPVLLLFKILVWSVSSKVNWHSKETNRWEEDGFLLVQLLLIEILTCCSIHFNYVYYILYI